MFEKILVCVDGSVLAEQIIPLAAREASQMKSKLVLLRVLSEHMMVSPNIPGAAGVPVRSTLSEEAMEKEEKEAGSYLDSLAADLLEKHGLKAQSVMERGPAGVVIVDYAEANNIDLIAIATHGRSGLSRAVLGSTADYVIRHTGHPILTLKPESGITSGTGKHTIERILVCLDGSRLSEQIIPYAVRQARAFGSKVIILQVVSPSDAEVAPGEEATPHTTKVESRLLEKEETDVESYLQRAAQSIQQTGLDTEWLMLNGTTAGEEIVGYAVNNHIDLITVATHGRGGLVRTVFGSVTDYVMRESGLPVLLIRPSAAS
jgi:nucleotide-binding universal stress UspA family protein